MTARISFELSGIYWMNGRFFLELARTFPRLPGALSDLIYVLLFDFRVENCPFFEVAEGSDSGLTPDSEVAKRYSPSLRIRNA